MLENVWCFHRSFPMNLKPLLLRLALAIGAACLLPSCEIYDTYPGGGYVSAGYDYYPNGGYYDDYDDGFYDYVPRYSAYDYWGPAHSYYFGGRYYSHAWWHDHDYIRYCRARDAHRARHRHSSHRSRPPGRAGEAGAL